MTRSLVESELLENLEVARDTVVLRYAFESTQPVVAGQFAMVHPGGDEFVLPRPLSILASGDGRIDFLVKVVGRGSERLASMRPGESVRIFAPLGRGFDHETLRSASRAILVGGGVGVVPLHMLARELVDGGIAAVRALFGARTPEDVPISVIEEAVGDWQVWVENGARGAQRTGLVTEGLIEALAAHPDAAVVTCGPTPMMKAVARICRDAGRPLQVCLEEQMGCGAGVCRACVVDDAREDRRRTVCVEGPVFDVETIRFLDEDGTRAEGASCG